MYHKISLGELPPGERFACWRAMVGEMYASVEIHTDRPREFRAGVGALDLGVAQVAAIRCSAIAARRTARLIRRADPECYEISLGVRGRFALAQDGRTLSWGPGEMVIYGTWRPFRSVATTGRGTVAVLHAQVPRQLIRLPRNRIDRIGAAGLSTRDGAGALLAQFLARVARDAPSYRPPQAAPLGGVLIDLVTAHHISVRALHRLFEEQDTTVTDLIRTRRLENCRRDLADPRQRQHPVRAIAARWGYPDPANFTRSFRAAYGVTPRAYRAE
jgi:AraC-like DNA-binding protein